jgi:hypothetical protein
MRIAKNGTHLVAGVLCLMGAAGSLLGGTPRSQWKLGEFSWVKRQRAETGAPANAHPAKVEAEGLRRSLIQVQFKGEKGFEPLFAPEELAPLVEPLREALSVAEPGEDLVLLSTHKRGGSFFSSPYGLTARFFVQDGSLNVLVHDTRLDFVDRYRGMQTLPEFRFGSRTVASEVEVKCPEANSRRRDWLQFPLASLSAPTEPPRAASPLPEGPRAATVTPPAAAMPKVRDSAYYEELEKRLRVLKRMREENLITDEEFLKKRQEILEGL